MAEEAPESLLLSRRLAGATVADARRRMPLLYPPLSAHERHLVLRELVRATAAIHNPTARNVMEGVIGELKRFWTDSEYHLHYRGASTTLGIGIGPLAAVLYQRLKGENLFLEFSSAGRVVEWGAALNASLFPIHTETFSAEGHSSILASIYSGVPNDPTLQRIGEAQTILDGILCIDNDAPVVEFASSFRGGDVDRLRELVRKLKEDSLHPDLLADSIRDFNKQVKSFERNSEKLARLRITGPLGTLATSLLPLEASTKVYIGLGSWFIDQLFFGPITSSNPVVGKLLDGLRGGITGNPASVVLSRWPKVPDTIVWPPHYVRNHARPASRPRAARTCPTVGQVSEDRARQGHPSRPNSTGGWGPLCKGTSGHLLSLAVEEDPQRPRLNGPTLAVGLAAPGLRRQRPP